MASDDSSDDLRGELAELRRATGAWLEWHRMTGSFGLPRGEYTPALVESEAPRSPAVARGKEGLAPARFSVPVPDVAGAFPAEARPPAPVVLAAPSEVLSPEERVRRLTVLAEQVKGCTKCGLAMSRTQTVFARGTGSSGLCFVGEGPGADEDAQGFPFVGKAGQLLDRMIVAMGLTREEVYVANIVKCRPPDNRKPEPDEMSACMPYLTEQLEIVRPSVIVALGATAVQGLFGTTEGITRMRGRWKLYKGGIAVMPTFHPAYLLREPAKKREVWQDLQEVLRQMGRPLPQKQASET